MVYYSFFLETFLIKYCIVDMIFGIGIAYTIICHLNKFLKISPKEIEDMLYMEYLTTHQNSNVIITIVTTKS